MARRRHTPDQVITRPTEAGVAIAASGPVAEAARRIGATGQPFYRRRSDCGSPAIDHANRPQPLESENIGAGSSEQDIAAKSQTFATVQVEPMSRPQSTTLS